MIAKGNTHPHGARLARYMMEAKDGERVVLHEIRGFGTDDLTEGLRSVHVLGSATKCDELFFHGYFRAAPGEFLTDVQWEQVADREERAANVQGQARAISFHIDDATGEKHMHVVWSRIDLETMTAREQPFFADAMMKEARLIEVDFGLRQVQSHRDYSRMQAPTRQEQEAARRLGVTPERQEANRHDIRALYQEADSGRALKAALPERGLMLARGDRRPFVVVDANGLTYALGKRLLGVNAAHVAARLDDLDPARLPSVKEATVELARQRTETQRERALKLAAEDAHDARNFYALSKEEKAGAQAKAEAARERRSTAKADAVNERLRGEEVGTTPGSSATPTSPVHEGMVKAGPAPRSTIFYDPERARAEFEKTARPAPIFDKEAAQVAADVRLLEGADRAAPEIAAREEREERASRAAEWKAKTERPLTALQGEVRLAYRTTDSASGFQEALTAKGMVLACVTEADIARRNSDELSAIAASQDSWMVQRGGVKTLLLEHREAAAANYKKWTESEGPEKAEKKAQEFSFEKYVTYVQGKWKERVDKLGGLEAIPALVAQREKQIAEGALMPVLSRSAEAGDLAVISRGGFAVVVNSHATGEERDVTTSRFAFLDRSVLPSAERAQMQQTAEKREHLARLRAVRTALASYGDDGLEVPMQQRVAFGFRDGQVIAATSRYTVALDLAEGQEALARVNAARFQQHERRALAQPFQPLSAEELPDQKEAQRSAWKLEQRANGNQPPRSAPRPGRPLTPLQGDIRLAYSITDGAEGFREALSGKGLALARVTQADIDRRDTDALAAVAASKDSWMLLPLRSLSKEQLEKAQAAHQRNQWAGRVEELGGVAALQEIAAKREREIFAVPALPSGAREGDVVAVTRGGTAVRLDARITGDEALSRFAFGALPSAQDAQNSQTAEKRGHFDRIEAARAAIAGDEQAFWATQSEARVAFGYQDGKVVAATGRYAVPLAHDEGQRVVDWMNGAQRGAHDERNVLRLARGEEVARFEPLQAASLPEIGAAWRMAYGLEKRAELAQTVTNAFELTVKEKDGGLAFTEALAARGIDVRPDQGKRLHIVADGRSQRLDQFISEFDQEKSLRGLAQVRSGEPFVFTSRDDRRDAFEEKLRRIVEEGAARARAAVVRQAVRAPVQAAQAVVAKAQPALRMAGMVGRGVGGLLNSATSLVADVGKHQEQEQAARLPAPPLAALPIAIPVVSGAIAQLRAQNTTARPDVNTLQLAATHSASVGQEFIETRRRNEEQTKLDNELAPDGAGGRERRRWR